MSTGLDAESGSVASTQRLTSTRKGRRQKPFQMRLRLDAGPRFADGSPYRVHRDLVDLNAGVTDDRDSYRTSLYNAWLEDRDKARTASANVGLAGLVSRVRSGIALVIGRPTTLGFERGP